MNLTNDLKQQIQYHSLAQPAEGIYSLPGSKDSEFRSYSSVMGIVKHPAYCFLIERQDQWTAIHLVQERSESLTVFLHSHLLNPAISSDTDLELTAYPNTICFIVFLPGDRLGFSAYYYQSGQFAKIALNYKISKVS